LPVVVASAGYILESRGWPGDFAVGSIHKALGLTIRGLIALGMLALFIFVGFEAALRFHSDA
jgi:hypothetical protein